LLRMRAMQAWADIDVQLQRVAELVPNLVNSLKGSALFEKKTLENIARAHAELVEAMRKGDQEGKVKAASNFMGVLMPIIYQIPQYPQLQTTETFRKLMDELSESMDKIAYARQFYNQAVADYNTFISLFPWNIVASLFNFKPLPFFQMPEREAVIRKLSTGEYTEELTQL
ncbi:MAG: LemA family protein, partial [Candidatus Diapherotrites archaeon]|nr:LemA family protein [Candidatus Diapherotrites archaeon]